MFLGLTDKQRSELEFVRFSRDLQNSLTRLIRNTVRSDKMDVQIVKQNAVVNIANGVIGEGIYELVAEDAEYYYPSEHGWHNSQIEGIFRRSKTHQSVEIIADLITEGWLDSHDVNTLFEKHKIPITFKESSTSGTSVDIDTVIEEEPHEDETQNVRVLVTRMDSALDNNDPAGVLHASASIFETLAKEVVAIPSVQNYTLASFFDRYRKDSLLPNAILDYMLEIYNKRNTEPLSGHGSTSEPSITMEEATVISELTKAIVKAEWSLARIHAQAATRHKKP